MIHTFSQTLAQYYVHKGNKIVFKNGLTLNQFALELWEKLGYTGIDSSALSRILSGERKFTPKQLAAFTQLLNLSQEQYINLQMAYCYEILSETGIDDTLINSLVCQTDDIKEGLKKTEQARAYDSQKLAYLWISTVESLIQSKIATATDEKIKIKLYALWGIILRKKGCIILEYRTHIEGISEISLLPPLFEKIYQVTGDTQHIGSAHEFFGCILFRQKKYVQSLQASLTALEYLTDSREILGVLGRMALEYALLGKPQEFPSIKQRMEQQIVLLDKTDYASPHYILDEQLLLNRRLANAYIISKNPVLAQRHLDDCWNIYSKDIVHDEANFKYRSKIVLYHSESLFQRYFGSYDVHHTNLEMEVKTLVDLCGYHQYDVGPGLTPPHKLL